MRNLGPALEPRLLFFQNFTLVLWLVFGEISWYKLQQMAHKSVAQFFYRTACDILQQCAIVFVGGVFEMIVWRVMFFQSFNGCDLIQTIDHSRIVRHAHFLLLYFLQWELHNLHLFRRTLEAEFGRLRQRIAAYQTLS